MAKNNRIMSVKRKSFFTLLELLIVMLVLSFATALTGIKIKQAYDEQRLLSEVQQIVGHLQQAQDLMLVMQADTKVVFERDGQSKGYAYRIIPQNKLNARLTKIVDQPHELVAIRSVEFEGFTPKPENDVVLDFFSRGLAMNAGRLILSDNESSAREGNSYQIVLQGYPHFISSQKYQPERRSYNTFNSAEIYPQVLLEAPKIDQVSDDKKKPENKKKDEKKKKNK